MEYFDLRSIIPKTSNMSEYTKQFLEQLAQQADGKIPKDLAEMLIRENNDPNYIIRIHRCLSYNRKEIFEEGLLLKSGPDLDYTTSCYTGKDIILLINVIGAYGYKNPYNEDASCIIVKIPKNYLEYEKGKTKPILKNISDVAEQSGGMLIVDGKYQTQLLPEFVLGSIEYSKGKITEFLKNENYRNQHTYSNEDLVCPQETINSYYNKNKVRKVSIGFENLDLQKQQESQINEIIAKENTEYEKHVVEGRENCRTEDSVKCFALQKMYMSRFKEILNRFKNVFAKGVDLQESIRRGYL